MSDQNEGPGTSDVALLYRRPLWSDWAFWVALVAFGIGVAQEVSTNYTNPFTGEVEIVGNELAFAFDATLHGGFYVLILSVVPALIRRSLRRRRTDPGGSSASKVSQQQDASASTWTLDEGWSPSDLAAVATRLIEEKIPHSWEGVRLFAPQRFENQIESLLDEVERVIGPRTDVHTDELESTGGGAPTSGLVVERPARRRRRWLWILAIASTVIVSVVAADWFLRTRELESLLDAVVVSESALEDASDEISKALERMYRDSYFSEDERKELRTLAAGNLADVLDATDQVASVSILPWHRKQSAAKSAFLAYAQAWEDRWRDVSIDEVKLGEASPDISATFRIAHRRMRAAMTWGFNDGRVERIFRD